MAKDTYVLHEALCGDRTHCCTAFQSQITCSKEIYIFYTIKMSDFCHGGDAAHTQGEVEGGAASPIR